MDTADRLSRLFGPLRRALLRSIRRSGEVPDVPESQFELLRALPESGTVTPRAVAAQLRLAPPTVSNLVKSMTTAGLVARTPDPNDLRTVGLSLTPRATQLLDSYNRISASILNQALNDLSAADRRTLHGALPALERLLAALERLDSTAPKSEPPSPTHKP
ncbi:MarR family winged helix-turn-helix transcriptional regulator [Nocardia transvalensis]|uniref:MarR family winged helix-turn-helix transcriptional regulator n=1 Tax=Nocardia transvalensis TaxID=37333 RepID=UPI0018963BB5|nr:MarR family transcriptional regulator [Nocardia transvalensis]MBF6332222.1 MarR family transcriptional regulator [Nocardia transvalensis]